MPIYTPLGRSVVTNTLDRKMLDKAIGGTAALMAHGDVNDPDFDEEKHGAKKSLEDHCQGYFSYKPEGSERTLLLHINTKRGREAIQAYKSRFETAADWLPEFLSPQVALQRLIKSARAHVVRQHGGIGTAALSDLSAIVEQEVEERRIATKDALLDLVSDPDYVAPEPRPAFDPELFGVVLEVKTDDEARASSSLPLLPSTPSKKRPRLAEADGVWVPTTEEYAAASKTQRKLYPRAPTVPSPEWSFCKD
jgi:hypothetical protein